MGAIDVVETLIKTGTTVKDAYGKAKARDATMSWEKFLIAPECTGISGQVIAVLQGLTKDAIDKALDEVRTKQTNLLNGLTVVQLSTDKLKQYDALLDVENQLMDKYAANSGWTKEWLQWVTNEALPILMKVAEVALPLLV